MRGLFALAIVSLAFLLPLVFAALGRHRRSTKIAALLVLAVVLANMWLVTVAILGELAVLWPSPWLLLGVLLVAYSLVAIAAFRRKLA